jgi:hypothetical protein
LKTEEECPQEEKQLLEVELLGLYSIIEFLVEKMHKCLPIFWNNEPRTKLY